MNALLEMLVDAAVLALIPLVAWTIRSRWSVNQIGTRPDRYKKGGPK